MKIEKRVSEKKRGRGRPSKMKNVTPLPSLIDFKFIN
jgi:predicted transcriptional regulator